MAVAAGDLLGFNSLAAILERHLHWEVQVLLALYYVVYIGLVEQLAVIAVAPGEQPTAFRHRSGVELAGGHVLDVVRQ